jgi:paraquat-inducible protein B
MSQQTPASPGPAAHLRPHRLIAWVWLIPVAAVLIVAWLGWQSLAERGPKITITFEDAEGLDAGHTPIRYKSVQVGTVESIDLSKDLSKVEVGARMDRKIEASLTSQTEFWVVKPRFSASGISGLSTLVSGYYIAMEPGTHGAPATRFRGLDDPPVVQADVPGTSFILEAKQLGSLTQGSPVSYRGIQVGQVQGYALSQDGKQVDIVTFVRSPYDRVVHSNSRFWNASGVSVSYGANGFKANVASLQALIAGGIAFDTPPGTETEKPRPGESHFPLFEDESTAEAEPEGPTVSYLIDFPGSVHGLGIGAPVELMGIQVGRVTDLHLEYTVASGAVSTPVTVQLEPAKVHVDRPVKRAVGRIGIDQSVGRLVEAGLRARLASGSLLTGARYVSLDFVPDATPAKLSPAGAMMEIPSVAAGDIDQLTRSASDLMTKLAGLPLPQVMANLEQVTAHLDSITGSPELTRTLANLDRTMANLQKVSGAANQQLPALLASLHQTADAAQATLGAANRMLGADPTAGSQGLPQAMSELTAAARSIRTLADFLDQHPEALLRGRASSP